MSSSAPNPFAEVNPYASPAVARPVEPWEAAGIGVWRDGSLMVVHEQALLPTDLCIKSGRPATHVREIQVRWSHWARWPREYLTFQVGLTRSWNLWLGRGRQFALIGMLALVSVSILAILARFLLPARHEDALVTVTFSLVASTCGAIVWMSLSHPLHLVRRRGKYYWLGGAHKSYLAGLSDWPYGT